MPLKKDQEDYMVSETGNWNVANEYSKIKIMAPLAKSDIFQDIATYGYESFLENVENWNRIPEPSRKLMGLEWLIGELLKLCENSKFAVKKDKNILEEIEKKLRAIKKDIFPTIIGRVDNKIQGTSSVTVNPKVFNLVLDKVIQLKAQINEPLNKNHLIFTDKEEFDPTAFKDRLKKRMIEKG